MYTPKTDDETLLESTDLLALADRWERFSKSWKQVERDRANDAPDIAGRAQARASAYLDCAEELREKANPTGQETPTENDQ